MTADAAPQTGPDNNYETDTLIRVLDHGFIELIDHLGDDLTVVNAARVSFGKRQTELAERDLKLIRYLAEHKHWSPFRHVQLQFHCKVPEFVARQWYKHVVGIAYSEGQSIDHAWNEISMRYVDASEFEFYKPDGFRLQSKNNRQASMDETLDDPGNTFAERYNAHCKSAFALYEDMVAAGVAREQARGLLPLSVYTEFYWTASLQAVVNFITLRKHEGAQFEIRAYADAVETLAAKVVPHAYAALLGRDPNG